MFRRKWVRGDGWACTPGGHLLQTEHVLLRAMTPEDFEPFLATVDDEVVRWQGFPTDTMRRVQLLRTFYGGPRPDPYYEHWLICARHNGEIIGSRSINAFDQTPTACHTGSWLTGKWREKGLGTEELRALLPLLNQHLAFDTVIAGTQAGNVRAIGQYTACGFSRFHSDAYKLPNQATVDSVWMRWQSPASGACPHRLTPSRGHRR